MILHKLAPLIRQKRSALGLSQAQLATLAGLSRATINDLETSKTTELGIAKLEKLLALLGCTLTPLPTEPSPNTPRKQPSDPLRLAAQTASVSYREALSAPALEESLVSGIVAPLYRAHLATLINEAPAPLLIGAVTAAAQRRHIKPKAIWKNLARWSHELQTTRVL